MELDWSTRNQATVATSSFASEATATRACVGASIGLRDSLLRLGIPVQQSVTVLSDSTAVVIGQGQGLSS